MKSPSRYPQPKDNPTHPAYTPDTVQLPSQLKLFPNHLAILTLYMQVNRDRVTSKRSTSRKLASHKGLRNVPLHHETGRCSIDTMPPTYERSPSDLSHNTTNVSYESSTTYGTQSVTHDSALTVNDNASRAASRAVSLTTEVFSPNKKSRGTACEKCRKSKVSRLTKCSIHALMPSSADVFMMIWAELIRQRQLLESRQLAQSVMISDTLVILPVLPSSARSHFSAATSVTRPQNTPWMLTEVLVASE